MACVQITELAGQLAELVTTQLSMEHANLATLAPELPPAQSYHTRFYSYTRSINLPSDTQVREPTGQTYRNASFNRGRSSTLCFS